MARRILIFSGNDKIGGVARPVINLSLQLAQRGYAVQTAFPGTSHFPALQEWSRGQGLDPQAAPAEMEENSAASWRSVLARAAFFRQSGAEVVSLHYGCNYLSLKDVLAARLAGCRCVASLYSPLPLSVLNKHQLQSTRLAARLCEAVTFLSDWSRRQYQDAGLPARSMPVIPPGMHVPAARPSREEARIALGLPLSAFVVTTHARLVPEKGVADVVEAAARLSDPNLRLVIAGTGPERDALERLAATRLAPGQVLFLGQVADIGPLYASADVFALATQMESFGIVFAEAALYGVPSVGTTAGAVPEIVLDGETGIIVPPSDVGAMAQALKRLRDEPSQRHRLGEAARERVYREFTDIVMANHFETLLSR